MKKNKPKKTDTDRAAAFVVEMMPTAFPNGWIVDKLRKVLKAVRADERARIKRRGLSETGGQT